MKRIATIAITASLAACSPYTAIERHTGDHTVTELTTPHVAPPVVPPKPPVLPPDDPHDPVMPHADKPRGKSCDAPGRDRAQGNGKAFEWCE